MNRWVWIPVILTALLVGATLSAAGAGAARAPRMLGLVINEDGNSIAVLDPGAGSVVGMLDTGGALNKPHIAAFDPASRRLYVGNKGANLAVYDLTTLAAPRLVANLTPGGGGEIHWVVLAGGLIWLAHEGDSAVYAYDPADLSAPKVTFGKAQGLDTTHGLQLRPGTDEVWVTNRPMKAPGTVLRIDARARAVIGQPLRTTGKDGDRPNNVGFTADGRWAYAVNTGATATQVTVIDAATFAVVGQIEQDAQRGLAPHAVVFESASGRLFIANMGGATVSAIDVATNQVVGYVAVGTEPHGVTLGPDGLIYAAAKKSNRVVAIDPRTLAIVADYATPALKGPHQILFVEAAAPGLPNTGAGGGTGTGVGRGGAGRWLAAAVLGAASLAFGLLRHYRRRRTYPAALPSD